MSATYIREPHLVEIPAPIAARCKELWEPYFSGYQSFDEMLIGWLDYMAAREEVRVSRKFAGPRSR